MSTSNTEGDGTCVRERPTHAELRAGGWDREDRWTHSDESWPREGRIWYHRSGGVGPLPGITPLAILVQLI